MNEYLVIDCFNYFIDVFSPTGQRWRRRGGTMTATPRRAIPLLPALAAVILLAASAVQGVRAAPDEVSLPSGVKAVWDLDRAHREKTATRERVCLNGLWRWQPGTAVTDSVPKGAWGYFKAPGFWPGT